MEVSRKVSGICEETVSKCSKPSTKNLIRSFEVNYHILEKNIPFLIKKAEKKFLKLTSRFFAISSVSKLNFKLMKK